MSHLKLFDATPKVTQKNNQSKLPIVENEIVAQGRFPSWLHRKLPKGGDLFDTKSSIKHNRLHTVCEEAKCPNITECYSKKTATFLIMGKECTRACGFCDIAFSKTPKTLDPDEPDHVACAVQELGLKHVVITMVARDDLTDGGAAHLVQVMQAVRKKNPKSTIETLTSDFEGKTEAVDLVLESAPEIFNHNVETVPRLAPRVRHKATFERSLAMLSHVKKKNPAQLIKSGIMVGLGETTDEVKDVLKKLSDIGCDIVTIGQYLQASRKKLQVDAFIHPDTFKEYEEMGCALGIRYMYAGPFVRSSYNANVVINNFIINSD